MNLCTYSSVDWSTHSFSISHLFKIKVYSYFIYLFWYLEILQQNYWAPPFPPTCQKGTKLWFKDTGPMLKSYLPTLQYKLCIVNVLQYDIWCMSYHALHYTCFIYPNSCFTTHVCCKVTLPKLSYYVCNFRCLSCILSCHALNIPHHALHSM